MKAKESSFQMHDEVTAPERGLPVHDAPNDFANPVSRAGDVPDEGSCEEGRVARAA